MSRILRIASLAVVTASLVLAAGRPLHAIGPAMLMFYGGNLPEPVLVFPGNPSYNATDFLWNPTNGGVPWGTRRGPLPPNLDGRRYMSVAIFWGRYDPATLQASDASQHGRIYLATDTEPAVIVITGPNMANPTDVNANPAPVPVPTSLDDFIAGWTLQVDIDEWIRRQAGHTAAR